MSANVYRAAKTLGNTYNNKALTVQERMCHEVLIDIFRAVCKRYGIPHVRIAKLLCLRKEYVYSVLNKRQFVPTEIFIDMCETLKVLVNVQMRINARQLTIPL